MTVTIAITDLEENGQVDIKIEFDPPIENEAEMVHTTASRIAMKVLEHLQTLALPRE